MKRRSFIRQQLGFTLVEVTVAAGIVTVLALGIATMMARSSKQVQSVSAKTDFNSLVTTLQAVFNNTSNCLQAFGGASAPTVASFPMTVSLNIGGQTIGVGRYGNNLSIRVFELTGKTAAGGTNQWVVPLRLEADRSMGGETAVGGNLISHTFNLIMTLDASDKVIGCSGQYNDFWVSTQNVNDITYLGGSVGIGTTAPVSLLDVNGTANAVSFMYKSDARLKENVRQIPDALERVLKLRGVMYDWKDREHLQQGSDQLGLIAQEVEAIFPEAVMTDSQTGIKSVAYGNLVAPMLEAIKQQQAIIRQQQREIAEIKKAIKK